MGLLDLFLFKQYALLDRSVHISELRSVRRSLVSSEEAGGLTQVAEWRCQVANPRVFVASTCYDLKYIRENLKYFIRKLGYEPVLSEEGGVFYDPAKHTHDSCVSEIPNCQMLVLIIGGRYGGLHKDTTKSITSVEYSEAVKQRIPVFALIEQSVLSEHHVYLENKSNSAVDESKIKYPAVDSTMIFDFIDDVRKSSFNNAIHPFADFSDIESYLLQQWAGLMFTFLASRSEQGRVTDIMSQILTMNDRIEYLSNQILKSVAPEQAHLLAQLYDIMLDSKAASTLLQTGHKPNPLSVLKFPTLKECAAGIGKPFKVLKSATFITSASGEIKADHLAEMEKVYTELRKKMIETVEEAGFTVDKLIGS